MTHAPHLAAQQAERLLQAQSRVGRLRMRLAMHLKRWTWLSVVNGTYAVKRLFDIVISLVCLLLAAPVFIIVALLIRRDGGPVFFKQKRVGMLGRPFEMLKFRSMCVDAEAKLAGLLAKNEKAQGVTFKMKDDPRVTPIGRFIRKTSLDELPQFINVLQGRMSIVGPRPHAVAHNEQYRELIKAYMVRHKVKPGITGWAQVNGHRGETDTVDKMQARVEYDLEYLRNWSLGLDLQIIARTVKLVFSDRNAF